MSGHSKWANIRVRKTAEDAKRGKIFTRHARLIEMAARAGGGDPAANATLRTAIENARAENVPNANIERAIRKGTGDLKGEAMAEILYAAYGPGGIACLIECLTDNRNRTLANIRSIIGKHGGNFADTNAVAWMFERRGVVVARSSLLAAPRTEPGSGAGVPRCPDGLELQLIERGADDIETHDDIVTITTSQSDWTQIRNFLEEKGFEVKEAGLKYVAKERTHITDETMLQKIAAFVEALEADDDVAEVHTNATTS